MTSSDRRFLRILATVLVVLGVPLAYASGGLEPILAAALGVGVLVALRPGRLAPA